MKNLQELIKKKEKICQVCYPNCNSCSCFSICFPTSASTDIYSKISIKENHLETKEFRPEHAHRTVKQINQIEEVY